MILPYGLAGFATAVLLHIALWRFLPKKRPAQLCAISFLVVAVFMVTVRSYVFGWTDLLSQFYCVLLLGALGSAYLISLPAIEGESPSSLIVLTLAKAGTLGASRRDLSAVVTDEVFVLNRLDGLLADGLVSEQTGELRITPAGRNFLNLFLFYYRLTGRESVQETHG